MPLPVHDSRIRFQIMARKKTLSIDVGASHIKAHVVGPRAASVSRRLKEDTPTSLTARTLTDTLAEIAARFDKYDRVSVGLPGIVHRGVVYALPVLSDHRIRGLRLADELETALGRPVRIMNDAEMHGLGVIRRRGVELVLTLGSGLGTAVYLDGELGPRPQFLPAAHEKAPRGGAYGDAARKKLGDKRWNKRVRGLLKTLESLTNFDRCYVGGGNAKRLRGRLGSRIVRVDNAAAALGGVRLWEWDVAP